MAGLTEISLANFTNLHYKDTTWKLCDNVSSIGEISDEATIVDVQEYGAVYLRKLVGSANAGTLDVVLNLLPGDDTTFKFFEGAYKSRTKLELKLQMTTAADTAGAGGSMVTFEGIVASKSMTNEFDSTRQVTFSIAIDGAISDLIEYSAS